MYIDICGIYIYIYFMCVYIVVYMCVDTSFPRDCGEDGSSNFVNIF